MKNSIKKIFVLFSILLFAISCATTSASVTSSSTQKIDAITETATSSAPVAEEPAATDQVVTISSEKADFKYDYAYDYLDYTINAEIHDGYGYVTYPSFIKDSEIAEALDEFTKAHGNFGITYKKVSQGNLEISFTEGLSKADFDYMANLIEKDLTWYLDNLVAEKNSTETVSEETVAEVSTTPATTTAAKTTATTSPAVATTAAPAAKTAEPAATTAPAKEKKGMPAILIILIILVVIIAGLYCFFCLVKKLSIKNFFVMLWNKIKSLFKKSESESEN